MHKPKTLPRAGNKALVYFRGGGCVYGTAEHRIEFCNALAVRTGCIVINCNYRKSPEAKFPLPVIDAYAIFMNIFNEAHAFGISPNNLAIVGESGGACIALGVAQMLAVSGHENLVRMLVLSWPMVGDFLCGGPTPDWTSYELSIKD